jgi:hypothetical protein
MPEMQQTTLEIRVGLGKNSPNKAMQPTPVADTTRAYARVAPATYVADLGRSPKKFTHE